MAFDMNAILAGFGGMIGLSLIVANSYHNFLMRKYAKKQVAILERIAGK